MADCGTLDKELVLDNHDSRSCDLVCENLTGRTACLGGQPISIYQKTHVGQSCGRWDKPATLTSISIDQLIRDDGQFFGIQIQFPRLLEF